MKLYDHPLSPYSQKVRLVLYEKGVDVELHEIWRQSQRHELFAVSPRGEVPALVDDATTVYDSTIICEYLEQRLPTPALLPGDAAGRALARAVERLADTSIDACALVIALFKFFRPRLVTERPQAFAQAEANLRAHYAHLERRLADREYFAGSFSRADLALIPHFTAMTFLGCPPDPTSQPKLQAWIERMNERPSVQRVSAEAMAALDPSRQVDDPYFENDRLHWRDARIEWLLRCGMGDWLAAELAADRAFFSPIPD